MTVKTTGFLSRANLNLRQPLSISHAITPAKGGCAVHYTGSETVFMESTPHHYCVTAWVGAQRYHMDKQGWVDIAYTGGFCQHGYTFAGRGFGVRTAANGTNDGNQNNYAFCFIGGVGSVPSVRALDALEWWIDQARRFGAAGSRVRGHLAFLPTSCPGSHLARVAFLLDNQVLKPPVVVPSPTLPPKTPQKPPLPPKLAITGVLDLPTRRRLQQWAKAPVDGVLGPVSWWLIRQRLGVSIIGLTNPQAWYRTWRAIQTWVGVPKADIDGIAGPQTYKYLQLYLNAQSALGGT